jgi:hypothetical protein
MPYARRRYSGRYRPACRISHIGGRSVRSPASAQEQLLRLDAAGHPLQTDFSPSTDVDAVPSCCTAWASSGLG